jgi:hypothetical protein
MIQSFNVTAFELYFVDPSLDMIEGEKTGTDRINCILKRASVQLGQSKAIDPYIAAAEQTTWD